MIMEGIQAVHNSECRALKAALERRAGSDRERHEVRYRLAADTIYIDAPIDLVAEYIGDARTMASWSHLLRPDGEILSDGGTFPRRVRAGRGGDVQDPQARADYRLVEQNFYYPKYDVPAAVPRPAHSLLARLRG